MGIEPTLPAWKAGTLPLSYTRLGRSETIGRDMGRGGSGPRRGCRVVGRPVPMGSGSSVSIGLARPILHGPGRWVEQDSNLRRHSHQIYSLAPLTTWVSTRVESSRVGFLDAPHRAGGESRTHNRRFTKPVLCRLSYASDQQAVKFLDYIAAAPRCKSAPRPSRGKPAGPTASESDRVGRGKAPRPGAVGRSGRTRTLLPNERGHLIRAPGPSARGPVPETQRRRPPRPARRGVGSLISPVWPGDRPGAAEAGKEGSGVDPPAEPAGCPFSRCPARLPK